MLLAKASLDTGQPKTALNCVAMIRGLRQAPDAAATQAPGTANDDSDAGAHVKTSSQLKEAIHPFKDYVQCIVARGNELDVKCAMASEHY